MLIFIVGDICPYDPDYIAHLRTYRQGVKNLGSTLLLIDAHEECRLAKTMEDPDSTPNADEILLLADPSSTVSAAYGVAMQGRGHTEWANRPSSIIIDRNGVILFMTYEAFDARIDTDILMQVLSLVNANDGAAISPRKYGKRSGSSQSHSSEWPMKVNTWYHRSSAVSKQLFRSAFPEHTTMKVAS